MNTSSGDPQTNSNNQDAQQQSPPPQPSQPETSTTTGPNANANDSSSSGSIFHPSHHAYPSYQQPTAPPAGSSSGSVAGTDNSNNDASSLNKRTALAGQWRTPPLPLFPTHLGSPPPPPEPVASSHGGVPVPAPLPSASSSSSNHHHTHIPVSLPSVSELPESAEDYEKALQEAYRRGAEAAAAMAAAQRQQQEQQQAQAQAPPVPAPQAHAIAIASASVAGQVHLAQAPAPQQAMSHAPTASVASSSVSGPPAPPPSHLLGTAVSCPDFHQHHAHAHHHPTFPPPAYPTSSSGIPDPLAAQHHPASPPPSMQPHHTLHHHPPSQSQPHLSSHPHATATTGPPLYHSMQAPSHLHQQMPPHVPPQPSSSTSLSAASVSSTTAATPMVVAPPATTPAAGPPMVSHTASSLPHAAAPTSLTQQPSHTAPPATAVPPPQQQQQRSMSLPDMTSYGAQQDEEKRQKRLARNRASAKLRRLRKKNLVDAYETEVGILEKTLKQLQAHEWGTMDNPRALTEALSMDRGQQVLTAEERRQAAADILQQQLDYLNMLEELIQEQFILQKARDHPELQDLKEALGLTPQQLDQLAQAHSGWEEEWEALQTVKASLQAMKDNNWLWNTGCLSIVEEFMSVLHKNQISKFLLWADHNVEAIDELDGVNAPSTVPQGPVFHFGVNSNPDGVLEEERL